MKMVKVFFGALLTALAWSACSNSQEGPLERVISAHWEFSEAGSNEWLPASVPGTVHADLMAAGRIPDPYIGTNEDEVQWVEERDWVYRTAFEVEADLLEKALVELEFKGLDTYADVYLNEQLILSADNMFVAEVVGVKQVLKEGRNDLRIHFHSPVRRGMEKLQQLDYIIPAVNEQAPEGERSNVFTRKAPFHYGWDWGPRLVTSGVWRPVILRAADAAVLEDVYLHTRSAGEEVAELEGHAEVQVLEAGAYTLSLAYGEGQQVLKQELQLEAGVQQLPLNFDLQQPRLWWSKGLGEAYLYDFVFELHKEGKLVDRHHLPFGVRTLRLVQEPDSVGRSFHFELNGVPVFMKGANVIPSHTLTPSVSKADYERLLDNAVAANMNMVRVWGGAIYEEDYFYELCDQKGILVWQDFMFACALQPGDEAHLDNIRREAEYNVKRLRNHASIALWCGNNENLHGLLHWWNDMFSPEVEAFMWATYERIFLDILPNAVEKHHPGQAYWSTSPSAYGDAPADRKSGDEHDWTIWFGEQPFSAYGENVPRFVSEYGLQSFPDMATIAAFAPEEQQEWDSPLMRHRQRGRMPYVAPGFDGNDMIRRYMARYYQVPEQFEDFVYVSQLMHAKAYKSAIEAHRRSMPHTMGSLYWQLNDSWPTISWSTVDYYGRWKASHYAVRKANAAVLLAPLVEDDRLQVFVVNDHLTGFEASLRGTLMGMNGTRMFADSMQVQVGANTSTLVLDDRFGKFMTPEIQVRDVVALLELVRDGEVIADNIVYMAEPRDLPLHPARLQSSWKTVDGAYELTLVSGVVVKGVAIEVPGKKVVLSDNYFDLLPGRPHTVVLRSEEALTESDLLLRSLNDLRHR